MAYDPLGGEAVAAIIIDSANLVENAGTYRLQKGPYLVLYLPGGLPASVAPALDELTDVVITSPANESVLFYNGSNWIDALLEDYAITHAEFSGSDGILRKTGAGTYTLIKVNLAATTDPTVGDDSADGYGVGSRWINTTTDKEFVCLDAAVGAAVWLETTAGATDELAAVSANDTTPDYLVTKLVGGANITLTETNDGSNETLVIAATGSLSSDIIQEGDSSVEVVDTGTGVINITVDGVLVAAINVGGYNLQGKLLEAAELKNYRETAVTENITGTYTIDLANGNNFVLTQTGSTTLTFPSGLTSGKVYSFSLEAIQGGAGSMVITWPAAVKWSGGSAPTQSTTVGARDLYQFYTRDGGTTWLGAQSGKGFA